MGFSPTLINGSVSQRTFASYFIKAPSLIQFHLHNDLPRVFQIQVFFLKQKGQRKKEKSLHGSCKPWNHLFFPAAYTSRSRLQHRLDVVPSSTALISNDYLIFSSGGSPRAAGILLPGLTVIVSHLQIPWTPTTSPHV
ncbi:hypothetical protein ACLOJK_012747 [Asimina triloba]